MAQCFTVYSFPEDLVIDDRRVFDFVQKISCDLNKKILKYYGATI